MKQIKDRVKELEFIRALEALEEYANDLKYEVKFKNNYEIVDILIEVIEKRLNVVKKLVEENE